MGWNLTDLEAAHPKAPARLVREYYHARQQEASVASRAEQAREKN